jgi:hypothetical protein
MAVALLHESAVDEVAVVDDAVTPEPRRDRRSEVRLSAADATWLRGARLKYGADVRVIDVSSGGILIEADGAAPANKASVVFELSGPKDTILAPARVLRSQVMRAGSYPRYQAACEFKRPLSIEALAAVTKERQPQTAARQTEARQTEVRPFTSPAEPAPRAAWQRVVARFRNGHIVRGYTNDFYPTKPHLHLTPEDRVSEPTFVPLVALKAVFFVREFAGDPNRIERDDFQEAGHGRKVEVTFEDGEVLLGTTLAYRADGSGFFVHPADPKSNNVRVFVAPGATKHVKLL